MAEVVGTVAELWRYPVKSMQGERLDAATAGERGLSGDRSWAVVDAETGKVVSAKRPSLWAAMLQCTAACAGEPGDEDVPARVRITLPDGAVVHTDDPDRDRLLSEALGRPVTLESAAPEGAAYELAAVDRLGLETPEPDQLVDAPVGLFAPPGTFFDAGTLHLITTASIESLAAAHPEGAWDVRRFRPNVVVVLVEDPEAEFPENAWAGRPIVIGSHAQAMGLAPMPRCVMTTLGQRGLPRDPLVLRTIAERNRLTIPGAGVYACAGVLANLTAPGRITVGDPVTVGASA